MNGTTFDTLAAAKALAQAGFDQRQAEGVAGVARAGRDGLATADIAMLRADLYRALWIQTGMIERVKKLDVSHYDGRGAEKNGAVGDDNPQTILRHSRESGNPEPRPQYPRGYSCGNAATDSRFRGNDECLQGRLSPWRSERRRIRPDKRQ